MKGITRHGILDLLDKYTKVDIDRLINFERAFQALMVRTANMADTGRQPAPTPTTTPLPQQPGRDIRNLMR
jgi:hypothetical protein